MPETNADLDSVSGGPNRILFPGSPWSDGHAIDSFSWSGRIEPSSGLWFDLHLESANYTDEDQEAEAEAEAEEEVEEEDDSTPNWESKVVWSNYQSCTLSSTHWDHGGFKVSSGQIPFDFSRLNGQEFLVDSLPLRDDAPLAFGIYLQGHDTAADHRISFRRREGKNLWSVTWQGRIALTYLGDDQLSHQFMATIQDATFDGIVMPSGVTKAQAEALLAEFVADPDQFKLEQSGEQFVFEFA